MQSQEFRLFTPGPLNTSVHVRRAAGRDLGSRSPAATHLSARLREDILAIAGGDAAWSAVPLSGSGTFAVEAMLCSLPAADDHLLIIENGVYSARMVEICRIHAIPHSVLTLPPHLGIDLAQVEQALAQTPRVTHIAAVHFETALGVINDIDGLTQLANRYGCQLLIDAISTFGVLPLDYSAPSLSAVALSANKCLHGLPGLAFVLVRKRVLATHVTPRTLSLDIRAQAGALEGDGQWRFTPPLQIMLALKQAIDEYRQQGGRHARYQAYSQRMARLLGGMARLGFSPVIQPQFCAPLIVTLAPNPGIPCDIHRLNDFLFQRGLVIYPTKHRTVNSFRIGVMGELSLQDIDDLLAAFAEFTAQAAPVTAQPAPLSLRPTL
ncbi:2-aminoethylphosphonate--pyruvate transaminase [Chimaeribacter californicus]|uniref:2-aminoethylphosphonate--pyruvate transaminase n=1 Tax=Chimaeribacter californicus TaxID=2060067 RepID=A0A2N5EDM9_9GAMM|nr:2-aminoethylphosphonate--pyruvate transaminase [Chimaeribacter californicus]PLR40648.1 2-aminoethylphosphonate--pyruvate transaminase [Chimaeribacter californicus]